MTSAGQINSATRTKYGKSRALPPDEREVNHGDYTVVPGSSSGHGLPMRSSPAASLSSLLWINEEAIIQSVFHSLADRWYRETGLLSSASRKIRHPAYRRIIAFGFLVLPYVLEDLRNRGGHWFHALEEITKENPVDESMFGDMDMMTAAWVQWGRQNQYIE